MNSILIVLNKYALFYLVNTKLNSIVIAHKSLIKLNSET